MIILVAFSLLWSSAAYTLSTMDTLVSPRVINIVQPMQRWLFLVTKPGGAGGDKEQLVVNGSGGGGGDNLEEGPTRADISMTRELPEISAAAVVVGVTPNQLFVQVLDRLLFALQLLLIIFLHNWINWKGIFFEVGEIFLFLNEFFDSFAKNRQQFLFRKLQMKKWKIVFKNFKMQKIYFLSLFNLNWRHFLLLL